jgi:hypothetical protein
MFMSRCTWIGCGDHPTCFVHVTSLLQTRIGFRDSGAFSNGTPEICTVRDPDVHSFSACEEQSVGQPDETKVLILLRELPNYPSLISRSQSVCCGDLGLGRGEKEKGRSDFQAGLF